MTLSLPRYRHPIDPTLMLLIAYTIYGKRDPRSG
jgi:hypothetical protein